MDKQGWTAQETTDPAGGDRKLTVKGQVTVSSTAGQARLVRHEPQGFNPTILLLDLIIDADGTGGSVMQPREVTYVEPLQEPGQYEKVQIQREGAPDTVIAVEEVPSLTAGAPSESSGMSARAAREPFRARSHSCASPIRGSSWRRCCGATGPLPAVADCRAPAERQT